MNEQKAREILGDTIQEDDSLFDNNTYISWTPDREKVVLDYRFTSEQLLAIAWWMDNKKKMEVSAIIKPRSFEIRKFLVFSAMIILAIGLFWKYPIESGWLDILLIIGAVNYYLGSDDSALGSQKK